MSKQLDTLTADVAAIGTVVDSAVTLIKGLAAEVRANATNPVALEALATSLESKAKALADAVAEGTAPPVTPVP